MNNPITTETPGYLSSEFAKTIEPFFVPRTGRLLGGCADDRPLTVQSAQQLTATFADLEIVNPDEAYASVYGGLAGITKNVAIAGLVNDPHFLDAMGGFEGITSKLIAYMQQDERADAVYFGLHSAEADEHNEAGEADGVSFCVHGDSPTGCAYCGGWGATSYLVATSTDVQNTARQNQIAIFGTDTHFDAIVAANAQLAEAVGSTYAVDRQMYATLLQQTIIGDHQVPFMVSAGVHSPATETGLIINLDHKSVGSVSKAARANTPIYRDDVTIAAEFALKAFAGYALDSEILLRSFIIDSTPVRMVLAGGKATDLAIAVRGDSQSALTYLRSL